MRIPFLLALAGATGLALTPAAVRAHAVQTNLERLDNLSASLSRGASPSRQAGGARIRLETTFSSGQPLASADVRLVAPDGGKAIEVGRTDADGRLTFQLPRQAGADWELQIDGGPGHRDYLELPAPSRSPAHAARPAPFGRDLLHAARGMALPGLVGALGLAGLSLGRRRRGGV